MHTKHTETQIHRHRHRHKYTDTHRHRHKHRHRQTHMQYTYKYILCMKQVMCKCLFSLKIAISQVAPIQYTLRVYVHIRVPADKEM